MSHLTRRAFFSLVAVLGAMICFAWSQPQAGGQPPKAEKPAAEKAEPIDFPKARALFQRKKQGEKLTPDEEDYVRRALEARKAGAGPKGGDAPQRDTKSLKPLTEMTAEDRHQGQDGGLYGGGKNTPPDAHRQRAETALKAIQPLDAQGKPAVNGRIVFISISMSNATQEFSRFKRVADSDKAKSSLVTIVDCAQGGQAMAEWVPLDARPWAVANERITQAGVTPEQVQAAWVKLANKVPQGNLETHGRKLQNDTQAVVQNAKAKFPNLRIVYFSSRVYGGYANSALNPEPYAYESAFAARWLIQDQINGAAALNSDPAKGPVKAPVLLWGPYLWANGVTPRQSDQLTWARDDFGGDGVHPSEQGRDKVARLLLDFFKTDPLAKTWFAAAGQ